MHVRALDLFSGGGGSSSGARKAGCDIVAGVDAWATASATYAVNFPEAKAIHDRLEGDSVLPAVKALGRIDLLLASPECTSHTCARGSRPPSEESRLTAMQVINHVEHFKPRWVVIENVIQMRKWERYGELATYLASTYALHEQVLDAADFGVPQTRRRLFMLCDREQLVGAVRTTARVHRAARLIIDETGTWATRPLSGVTASRSSVADGRRHAARSSSHSQELVDRTRLMMVRLHRGRARPTRPPVPGVFTPRASAPQARTPLIRRRQRPARFAAAVRENGRVHCGRSLWELRIEYPASRLDE